MCGIIGYIGQREASSILIGGLKCLEYRGYDSAGMAVFDGQNIQDIKIKGKIFGLAKALEKKNLPGKLGIAHTRWATHGAPSIINAHPHFCCSRHIAIVHNGIIENYANLRKVLIKEGHHFSSETDSEVLAHLIEKYHKHKSLTKAIQLALKQVIGAYALVVISATEPQKMIAIKKSSSLILGLGQKEYLLASDASAIIPHTKKVIYLDDNEMVVLSKNGYRIHNLGNNHLIKKKVETINWNLTQISKDGFKTFMLKEIFEQPESIANAFRGRFIPEKGQIKLGGLETIESKLPHLSRIIIVACGSSWHAGLVGGSLIEELAKIPVKVEYASEFRYRYPVVGPDCLVIAISQSGETADTIAALELAKTKKALTFGICNVVGSSIARLVDAGAYLHAGPEIGVATTKGFTSQLIVLTILAIHFANLKKTINRKNAQKILKELTRLPVLIKKLLDQSGSLAELAQKLKNTHNCLYLGRGYNFPIALEGALKLKEISYIHAEGYPAAEMKHGPIALIDKKMPTIFIATQDKTYKKIISNMLEVKARNGMIIALATVGDKKITSIADKVIYIPRTIDFLMPVLNTIPCQLLAYHIAILKGHDIDKPRNLAKSVTVE